MFQTVATRVPRYDHQYNRRDVSMLEAGAHNPLWAPAGSDLIKLSECRTLWGKQLEEAEHEELEEAEHIWDINSC